MEIGQSIVGIVGLFAIAWALSEQRRQPPWKTMAAGFGIQFSLALLFLKLDLLQGFFEGAQSAILALQAATIAGTGFVFGYVGGGDAPFEITNAGASFILAFQALPLIIVMSAISALLWHWRVMPIIMKGFSFVFQKTLGVRGAVGLSAAANMFVGMIESPLLIRPYLARLSRSELYIVLTVGMSTVAGSVLALYAMVLQDVIDNPVKHLLIASLLNAPAGIMIARILIPETAGDGPGDTGTGDNEDEADFSGTSYGGSMEAVTRGTADGLQIFLNIVAMLIVLVALVALVNFALGLFPDVLGAPLTLQRMLGWIFAPFVWLMGIPWAETVEAGALMGTKTVLNEIIAYIELANLPAESLSERSRLILTYAICGFANLGSVGIMIGGLTAMAPDRREDIINLAPRTVLAGTLATSMTGAIVGLITLF